MTRAKVLVAGGGPAALEVVLGLAELAADRADVELVAPEPAFAYRPLAVAETFGAGEPFRLELSRLVARAGARLHPGAVVSVDEPAHVAFAATGEPIRYDLLVVACGTRLEDPLPGALTFRGAPDAAAFRSLLAELETGEVASAAFAVPPGPSWPLPLYELALMTSAHLAPDGPALSLVTPEDGPLAAFGTVASAAVGELLAEAGIEVHRGRYAASLERGALHLVPSGSVPAERAVTLPRLHGQHVAGLPTDHEGFLPIDRHGLVRGTADVYAAGDATAFPLKHGGIAIQQAAAVAEAIAARLGAPIRPAPFRPLLRGLLLTGDGPRFLAVDPAGGAGETSTVAAHPLWWPPGKIAGGRLADFLRAEGLPVPPPPAGRAALPVDVDLAAD